MKMNPIEYRFMAMHCTLVTSFNSIYITTSCKVDINHDGIHDNNHNNKDLGAVVVVANDIDDRI